MTIEFDGLKNELLSLGIKDNKVNKIINNLIKNKEYGLVLEPCENDKGILESIKNNQYKLDEDKGLSLFNGNDKTNNVIIEGENLVSLDLLLEDLRGKIDTIITDPPYNYSLDVVYKNNYKHRSHKFKYSEYLSMMKNRLERMRELLTDEGVIFININATMYEYLKVLCDDIFGYTNHVITFIWEHKVKGNTMGNAISMTNEYILMYAKDKSKLNYNKMKLYDKEIISEYREEDKIGRYRLGEVLHNRNLNMSIYTRPNLAYTIYYHRETNDVELVDEKITTGKGLEIGEATRQDLIDKGYIRIYPKLSNKYKHRLTWRWSMEKFMNEYKDNIIFLKDDEMGYYPYVKARIKEDINGKYYKEVNYVNSIKGIHTAKGTLLLSNMFGKKVFDYPKPIELVEYLLDIVITPNKKDSIVLDAFCGSGSTLHGVLEYNNKNYTQINSIGLTNNENNICREVTYERIKKVIEGYTTYKGKEFEPIHSNLRYFKVIDNV